MAERKKSAGKGSSKQKPKTRCEEGGKELLPNLLQVEQDDKIKFRIYVCKTNARVRVDLDKETLFDDDSAENDDLVEILLPPMAPGIHNLHWGWNPAAKEWQTRDEVTVNDATRFRRRKGNDSDLPGTLGNLVLKVLA